MFKNKKTFFSSYLSHLTIFKIFNIKTLKGMAVTIFKRSCVGDAVPTEYFWKVFK